MISAGPGKERKIGIGGREDTRRMGMDTPGNMEIEWHHVEEEAGRTVVTRRTGQKRELIDHPVRFPQETSIFERVPLDPDCQQ
jgi:hypothetical protein